MLPKTNNHAQLITKTTEHPELHIIKQLVDARHDAKKTQATIARAMNTTASAVARLESGGGKKRHSPSVRTLRLYANALGCDIVFQLAERTENTLATDVCTQEMA